MKKGLGFFGHVTWQVSGWCEGEAVEHREASTSSARTGWERDWGVQQFTEARKSSSLDTRFYHLRREYRFRRRLGFCRHEARWL
jgi:hypothetical protein